MNFFKKALFLTVFAACPLFGMKVELSPKQALIVFGFTDKDKKITKVQMTARYFELAKKHHPDTSKEKNATEMMQKINAAHEILKGLKYPVDVVAELAKKEPVITSSFQPSYQSKPDYRQEFYAKPVTEEEKLFFEAIRLGKIDEVKKMLDKNKNLANVCARVLALSSDQYTPMVYVIWSSPSLPNTYKIPLLKILLSYGADINGKSGLREETPLMEAVRQENKEVIEFLLDAGARVFETNICNNTVFYYIHQKWIKNPNEIYALFKKRFNPRQQQKRELHQLQVEKNLQELKKQRETESAFSHYYRTYFGYSSENKDHVEAFSDAIRAADFEKVKWMLYCDEKFLQTYFPIFNHKQGAFAVAVDKCLDSSLNSSKQRMDIIKLFMSYGADIDIQDESSRMTPLMETISSCCSCNALELMKLLLSAGARVDIYDYAHKRVFDWFDFWNGTMPKEIYDIFEQELCGPLPPKSKL